ncbi:GNAT family N-acetyltransferase [Microbacterium sp. Marseille-Q6965]|uniref:GNAT family N-acetyltransferase n=1 Tax=Microbacterium sp. Marseille-Q6965 TaxID=2965072 RepID=UPI0021B7FA37|nr:GNAT family protein [Microbacterium sp. Marseille-Q6965]
MSFVDTPVLRNDVVRLEPLDPAHATDLAEAVAFDNLWRRAWFSRLPAPEDVPAEIEKRLARQAAGEMAPWAIVDARTGRAIGMTSICGVSPHDRRAEIGYTWLRADAQGTGINAAAKLLLLTRAFDDLGCVRVEFCTHWHNQRSRAAIERLGAKLDGVLRSHTRMPDGHWRDTVVYSILASEWPQVRRGLEARLEARAAR